MNNFDNINHPILILIRGLPGSGKTYLARSLSRSLPRDAVVMLDPDATDYNSPAYQEHTKNLSEEGLDTIFHPYRFLRAQAYQGIIDHKIIIWNQPFTNSGMFRRMVDGLDNYANEHGTRLKVLVVEVETDPDVAHSRVKNRKERGGHGPSEEVFRRFAKEYVSFSSQGYNTVSVDGGHKVEPSIYKVKKSLDELIKEDL